MKDPAFSAHPDLDVRLTCKDKSQNVKKPEAYTKGSVPRMKMCLPTAVQGRGKPVPEMHRVKEGERGDWFGHSFWDLVLRDITRSHAKTFPRAQAALDAELLKLKKARTWLEDQIMKDGKSSKMPKRRTREFTLAGSTTSVLRSIRNCRMGKTGNTMVASYSADTISGRKTGHKCYSKTEAAQPHS